jgi:hypothetical protein
MKTTVDVPDDFYRRAAAWRGSPFSMSSDSNALSDSDTLHIAK